MVLRSTLVTVTVTPGQGGARGVGDGAGDAAVDRLGPGVARCQGGEIRTSSDTGDGRAAKDDAQPDETDVMRDLLLA